MKPLTKDDFTKGIRIEKPIIKINSDACVFVEIREQILNNQEKAEKYDSYNKDAIGFMKAFSWLQKNQIERIPDYPENDTNREIVERLKKFIDDYYQKPINPLSVKTELQKILGEGK